MFLSQLRTNHIRTRLTVWYIVVFAGVLLLSWALTAAFFFYQSRNQLDHYAVQDIETVEGLLYFQAPGRLIVREDYHNHPESKQVLERFVEVRSAAGEVLYRNDRLQGQPLGGDFISREGEGSYSVRSARLVDGTRVRMVSRRHTLDGHDLLVRLGYSEENIWSRFEELLAASLIAGPFVLLLAGLGGYLLAQRALAPIEEMACRAEQITSERLHERLPNSENGDELGHLARIFNGLLGRLEQSFEQLQRFTSDASHELRTPLASLRSVGEVALQKDGTREQYRDTIGSMLEEVNRLSELVDSLLTISRADAGGIKLHPTVFSAMDLAREATSLFDVLIEEKEQRITVAGDEKANVTGDRLFLRQALINIIHNAVKFSPVGGSIEVTVRDETGGRVCLEILDTGPGVKEEHATRIFDRFYRAEENRSRDGTGAGLGLSIAQWAVKANGGELTLISSAPGGSIFQLHLPCR